MLVGDWGYTITPRGDLTRKEQQQMQAIRAQLKTIDDGVKWNRRNWRHKSRGYPEAQMKQAYELRKQLDPYLQRSPQSEKDTNTAHGHVWVFLHK
jgi:hypothetical protein